MDVRRFISLFFLILLVNVAPAQTGRAEYEMYCGSCHNQDGKGAGEGAFPPLAASEWVKGDPERMVQVILHGLEGRVKVANKSYNLAMPPQGESLTDKQIALIVSYVRQAWGNGEGPIGEPFVKSARKRTQTQNEMWKPSVLLKRWPLSEKPGPLRNLKATVYKGDFQTMPDFAKLEPFTIEEVSSGYIDLALFGMKPGFAVVWEGEFEVKQKGGYVFRVDSDDGSRVFVNGELVTEIKRAGAMGRATSGRAMLESGLAKLRVEYFDCRGRHGIALDMKKSKDWTSFTRVKTRSEAKHPSILLAPEEESRIFRNFIAGTSPRAIGVGYPEGVNLAFSADGLGLGLAWLGDFIDAGRHWTGRGKGFQKPAGQRILSLGEGPAWAKGDSSKPWPKAWQPELKAQFNGYHLDKKRRPEFRYEVAGLEVLDKPQVLKGKELVRNFTIKVAKNPPKDLLLRLSGPGAKAVGTHAFQLSDGVRLEVADCAAMKPVLTQEGVVVQLKLKTGSNRLGMRYVWK